MNESNAPAAVGTAGAGNANTGHPYARVFHVAFKVIAVVYYLIVPIFWDFFTLHFTIVLVVLVADFWTVKNATGRLLVGLRWWNDVSEAGEGWRFETLAEGQRAVNKHDKWWFWLGLLAQPALWCIFTIINVIGLKFDWVLLCVIAIVLGGSNLWGYFKCSREAKSMLQQYAQDATKQATQHAIHSSIQSALDRV